MHAMHLHGINKGFSRSLGMGGMGATDTVKAKLAAAAAVKTIGEKLLATGAENCASDRDCSTATEVVLGDVPSLVSDDAMVLRLALQGVPDNEFLTSTVLKSLGVYAVGTLVLAPVGFAILTLDQLRNAVKQGRTIQGLANTDTTTTQALDRLAQTDPAAANYVGILIMQASVDNDYTLEAVSKFKKYAWYGAQYAAGKVVDAAAAGAAALGKVLGAGFQGATEGLGFAGWAALAVAGAAFAWWMFGAPKRAAPVLANRRKRRRK